MTDAVTVAAPTRYRAVLLTASMAAALTGCQIPAGPVPAEPSAAPATLVALRVGDDTVAATLTGTPSSRQFTAMLPLTVQLRDVWGQAKSGRLPGVLTAEGSIPIHDPVAGGIYFWPHTEVIAVYYDDLGQPVPGPGLVRLGVIDSGLARLANAGERVTVRIELATETTK